MGAVETFKGGDAGHDPRLQGDGPARAADLSASALHLAKGLSALVWAGVLEMEIKLSRFTCSRRVLMRPMLLLFAIGRIERVAESLTQYRCPR